MKVNAPKKIYMPNELLSEDWQRHIEGEDTEYTRTDAFIEKACDVYCKVCKMPNCRSNECKLISEFKRHLENM